MMRIALKSVLSATLLASGLLKLRDMDFVSDSFVRRGLSPPFARRSTYAVSWVEIAIGLTLWIPITKRTAATMASVLMALFTVAQARDYLKGFRGDCNCFGRAFQMQAGAATVLRNMILFVVSVYLALRPPMS